MLDTVPTGDSPTRVQREPKYWGLKRHLLDMLRALPPGSPIPTERSLAAEFDVSRTTVRQALAELTVEGRLLRVQGKGTFAAEPKVAQRLQLSSYTEDMRAVGRQPTTQLPLGRFRGLRRQVASGESLYQVLRERFQIEFGHAEETIETALAGPDEAEILGADIGLPMLLLSRHSFDRDGRPVEYARAIYRGDRYKFVATLNPPTAGPGDHQL